MSNDVERVFLPLPSGTYLDIPLTELDEQDKEFVVQMAASAYAKMALSGSRRSANVTGDR